MRELAILLTVAAALCGCFAYGTRTDMSSGVTCHSSFSAVPFHTNTSTDCVDANGNPVKPPPASAP
jgi:hypothetical protein